MSDHVTADLGRPVCDEEFGSVLYHSGDASAPLNRWRRRVQQAWEKGGEEVKRHAADLLLAAADVDAAGAADAALRTLLTPAGMVLKHTFAEAVADVRAEPAGWLGYAFHLDGGKLRVRLGGHAFDKLGRRFLLAHAKCRPAERALAVMESWVGQLGPCFAWEDRGAVCDRVRRTAAAHGFGEALTEGVLSDCWAAAHARWRATRRHVRRNPGYLTDGPLGTPTPTSVVW